MDVRQQLKLITFVRYPPLEAALELGYFEDEGLAVGVELTPSSLAQMQGLTAGRWDLAITAFDNLLVSAIREGVPSVTFALADVADLSLYARPEIAAYADLRGRALAADAVDTAFALVLRRLLLAHGLDLARGDYRLVAVGGNPQRLESLQRGETYAAILAPPYDRQAAEAGLQRLGHHAEVLPDYPGQGLTATAAWLADPTNRDAAARFLRAWLRGVAWVTSPASHRATLALLARRLGVSPAAAQALLAGVAVDVAPNLAAFASVRDLRAALGLLGARTPPLERFYDTGIYEQARR
jgi:ABC-type nitrate/sulfonate/bicarbonate transport system substrate-binding protein